MPADRRKYLRAVLDLLTEPEDTPNSRVLPARVRRRLRQELASWAKQPGIQGFGVGHKITGPHVQRRQAIRVYVERKILSADLAESWRIPKEIRAPGLRTPIPTDVIEVGRLHLELVGRPRPAFPGVGIGCGDAIGTLGLVVRRPGDPEHLYILSNAHVLAGSCMGRREIDEILQPCSANGGLSPGDVIATLWDFVDLEFGDDGYPNFVDAAIARVPSPSAALVDPTIHKIGKPTGISGNVRVGMLVQKSGAGSAYTVGTVQATGQKVQFWYAGPAGLQRAGFQDLTLCSSYSVAGDSGSAVLDMSGKVVGLHIGGSGNSSFFCGIRDVFSLLGVTLT
jgi:S1-C subfamily serine protease